jgi:hypothetical protein
LAGLWLAARGDAPVCRWVTAVSEGSVAAPLQPRVSEQGPLGHVGLRFRVRFIIPEADGTLLACWRPPRCCIGGQFRLPRLNKSSWYSEQGKAEQGVEDAE